MPQRRHIHALKSEGVSFLMRHSLRCPSWRTNPCWNCGNRRFSGCSQPREMTVLRKLWAPIFLESTPLNAYPGETLKKKTPSWDQRSCTNSELKVSCSGERLVAVQKKRTTPSKPSIDCFTVLKCQSHELCRNSNSKFRANKNFAFSRG